MPTRKALLLSLARCLQYEDPCQCTVMHIWEESMHLVIYLHTLSWLKHVSCHISLSFVCLLSVYRTLIAVSAVYTLYVQQCSQDVGARPVTANFEQIACKNSSIRQSDAAAVVGGASTVRALGHAARD